MRCAAAVVILASGVVAAAPAASATSNSYWSVYPTSPSTDLPVRPFFAPVMAAGSTYPDAVTVANQTTAPLTFNLYPADAFNTASGGFSLRPRYQTQHQVGAWIHLEVSRLTVPARTAVDVPFVIDAPADVTPGYHVGGIVAEATKGTTTRKGSLQVTVLQAVATRVYLRILGPLVPRLAVTKIAISSKDSATSPFGGAVTPKVRYTVTNTGNEQLAATATVTLSPLFGSHPRPVQVKLPQILPGNSVTFTAHFPRLVAYSYLTAHVTLVASGMPTAAGSASSLVLPWALIVAVVLVAAGLELRRRRRRRNATPAAGGAAPTPKVPVAG